MKEFLREYWPWIVVPFVLVVGGLLLLAWLWAGEDASPFVYNV
jgi:hypothetical protein